MCAARVGGTESTLHLYRRLLRSAQSYPSIKRPSIIKQLKDEFRASKDLPEGKERTERLEEARTVLYQLERYTTRSPVSKDDMSRDAHRWTYSMNVPGSK